MPRPPIRVQQAGGDPWAIIENGVKEILGREQSSLSLSALHTAVGSLVSQSKLDQLGNGLISVLKVHFDEWSRDLSQVAGGSLIGRCSAIYEDFQNYCRIIPKFYMLYDRRFDTKNGRSEIGQRMRDLFCKSVLSDRLLKDTSAGLRKNIATARSRGEVDLGPVKKLVEMYYSFRDQEPKLPIFDDFFEALLGETERFYDNFYKVKYEGNSFETYLQIASEQFAHDEQMMCEILKPDEVQQVLGYLHSSLLLSREDVFCDGAEPPISLALKTGDTRPIKWLVDMYRRFGSDLAGVFGTCAKYVETQMLKMIPNFKPNLKSLEASRLISELIDLTTNLTRPYELVFSGVPQSMDTLERHIFEAWNKPEFDIVNNFCTYIDQQLKQEFKSFSPEQRDKFPALVALFYTRLEDKKAFFKTYDTSMLRRLIKMQEKVVDLELPIIKAIRRAKAPDFASNFAKYVKRIKDSHQDEADFKEELARVQEGSETKLSSFSPLIFELKAFPFERHEARALPGDLGKIHSHFTASYYQKHANTKLTLLADLSTIESKFHVPKNSKSSAPRTYTLTGDVYGTFCLYAVADGPKTTREIIDIVGERSIVLKHLAKMCVTGGFLARQGKNPKSISDDDVFQLNPEFFHKNTRLPIQPVESGKKADKERNAKVVDIDKSESVKAAAVRVLKMRLQVEQSVLEQEVVDMLIPYFRADPQLIRRQLATLENEDYFERGVADGKQVLIYLQ